MNEVEVKVLESLRARITKIFPAQIHACVERLSDDQVWWRPNDAVNSIGNLIIHLTGSLNHFLNRDLGGFPYDRDRDAEFAERRHLPKAELLEAFDDMVSKAEATFARLTPESLRQPSPEPKMYSIVVEDLIGVATHISNHAGQIVWVTKLLTEAPAGDIWMKTHRELGGWKPR